MLFRSRQGYQKFREAVSPFEGMIRAEGGEVVPAIQGLLQTAHMLRTAPAHVKAQGIARMVQTFLPGREGLELLDATLSGQAPQAHQQAPQQFQRDPEVQALLDRVKQAEQARSQRDAAEAQRAVEEISQEEFFEDVRQEMADLIEVAKRRGLALTVKDA